MTTKVFVKLPSYEILSVDMVMIPSTRVCDLIHVLRETNPDSVIFNENHMWLVHNGKKLNADAYLASCAIKSGDTIEIVLKMTDNLIIGEEIEYATFLKKITPLDNSISVPIDVEIRIVFGPSRTGLCIYTPALLRYDALLPSIPNSGDMMKNLGVKLAPKRGCQKYWTDHMFYNRVFLLEIDSSEFSFREKLNKSRYLWHGINGGYTGGDHHSWQRYSRYMPIECKIAEEDKDTRGNCTVVLTPYATLKFETYYCVLLSNNVPIVPVDGIESLFENFTSIGTTGEDKLLFFKTVTESEHIRKQVAIDTNRNVNIINPNSSTSPSSDRRYKNGLSGSSGSPDRAEVSETVAPTTVSQVLTSRRNLLSRKPNYNNNNNGPSRAGSVLSASVKLDSLHTVLEEAEMDR